MRESEQLPPIVGALYGILKDRNLEVEDYHRYLEQKYLEEPEESKDHHCPPHVTPARRAGEAGV